MAYDRVEIVGLLRRRLNNEPGLTRSQAAAHLGMERHTLMRVLKDAGQSFDQLQTEARISLLETRRRDCQGLIRKEVVALLGFRTYRSLRAWWLKVSPRQEKASDEPAEQSTLALPKGLRVLHDSHE
jgi:hypothetical protein